MNIQKSFQKENQGKLYVVPTPIGNLEDITYRALNVLRTVTVIAAEDTRHTKKLLSHFQIQTPMTSYHEHSKEKRTEQLLNRLKRGESVALVSDAGMPAISDPGYELVQSAIDQEIAVVVLPGANAALCALVGSGLATDEFLFYGFLPRKKNDKESELQRLQSLRATLIFYESPYRLKDTLSIMQKILGNRNLSIARELTKRFEEYIRGTIDELLQWAQDNPLKGEFCLIVEGNKQTETSTEAMWWSHLSVKDHVEHYVVNESKTSKEAIKHVALERRLPKREVYRAYHIDG